MKRVLSLVLSILCLGQAGILGQQPQPIPPQQPTRQNQRRPQTEKPADDTVKISATLVQVDAVVIDGKGRPVADLKAEDFEILEDGRRQPITNFSYVVAGSKSSPAAPAAPAGEAAKSSAGPVPPMPLRRDQVRRTVALVVDDLNLSFESTYDVREALKKFVDEQMQPGDLVAILRTSAGMGALQQFTTDKRQLYAAIDRVRWSLSGRGGIGAFAPVTPDRQIERSVGGSQTEKVDGGENMDAHFSEVFTVGTLGALNYVTRGLAEMPGRKSVILFTDGLPLQDAAGLPIPRIEEALRRLTDQANRASVVFYAIDTRGLVATGMSAQDDFSKVTSQLAGRDTVQGRTDAIRVAHGALNILVNKTGGFLVHSNNDLGNGVGRIVEEQKGYYLLGYMPEEATFKGKNKADQFHKIEVRVKRAGLQVRSRSGFYAAPEEAVSRVATPREQILTALTSPFVGGEVGLRLTSLFGNEPKAGSYVRSLLHIDAGNLTFRDEPDGWKKSVINILAVTFGDNGIPIDQKAQTYGLRVRGELYEQALRDGLVYTLDLPMKKAGAYQLRVAVRDDATGRTGSANQFIEVPDVGKDRLALSGIVLQGVDPKAAQGGAGAELKAGGEAAPQASPAVRQIKRGMQINYGVVIYNGKVEKSVGAPQLETEVVLYREGQAVFRGPASAVEVSGQKDMKRVVTWGGLQLPGSLEGGQYVLQVVVKDKGRRGKQSVATQWIDFEYID